MNTLIPAYYMPLLIRTPLGIFWPNSGHFPSNNTSFWDEKISKNAIVRIRNLSKIIERRRYYCPDIERKQNLKGFTPLKV